ncbi:uncharacterized protein LOC134266312 [Saccostrea cucullata]|uniref:uncharacterized protein LOC134266312 n=1 Tax=Saccostrea cuccullata TaxID=36930 RepID=UPI002ED32C92
MSGAKDLLAGAHSSVERLEHFSPIIEELFHIEQDFLEKLYKKFYTTQSMRQQGSLAFYKCQLKRSNVNGQVKGAFQPHSDFVHTVGEALLVRMCMEKFSMDTLESKPDFSKLNMPENIGKAHIKTRLPYFRQVVEQIVDELYMGFNDLGCLPPVTVNVENVSIEIPREQLNKHDFVDLKFPSGATFRVYNGKESTDDLQNYTIQFLMWYLHFVEFQDGIKEGDPYRTNINIKRMIPFFYSHSNKSKYAVECIDYILKSEVLLPESLSMRLRLSSFVNPHGIKGGNKPADMQQENNILVLKDVIKGLGAHKTNNAMERASAAAPVIAETVDNHISNLGCHMRRGVHCTKDKSEDVKHLVDILGTVEPFKVVENRKMVSFSSFRRNPFSTISCEFQPHLLKIIGRLRRGQNIDIDNYDQ